MTRRSTLLAACIFALAAGTAAAQKPSTESRQASLERRRAAVQTAPEASSFDEHLARYRDPWTRVRENAEFRADNRRRRIAARQWYGISNARPMVNPTPWGAGYRDAWILNTGRVYRWAALAQPTVVVPWVIHTDRD